MHQLHSPKALRAACDHPEYRKWFGERFRDRVSLMEYESGDVIIRQGIDHEALCVLLEGRVCISAVLPNGKHRILRMEQAPALLGEQELLVLTPPSMSVRALSTCRIVRLPYAACRAELLEDPAFLRTLSILLGQKERDGVQRLFRTFSYPLENRLARFILDMQEDGCFKVRKTEAADSLGVSYRHLGQVLGSFVEKRYLEKQKFTYIIRDPAALERLAGAMDA